MTGDNAAGWDGTGREQLPGVPGVTSAAPARPAAPVMEPDTPELPDALPEAQDELFPSSEFTPEAWPLPDDTVSRC